MAPPANVIDREFSRFQTSKRFPALDGLRALSILMVLTAHTHDDFWAVFNGSLGVTLFFGISGFLITTLLLREQDRYGAVSLSGFYIRRVFRIAPLYFLALGAATVLVLVFKLGDGGDSFLFRLPLLATFNGEFAGTGTFSHSWSLGIEEKFYVLWPLLAFGVPWVRTRLGWLLAFVIPLSALASFLPPAGYLGIYMPILGGCGLAVAAHSRQSFSFVYALANPLVSSVLFIGMLAFAFFETSQPLQDVSNYAHVAFGALVLLAMPGTLLRHSWQRWVLSTRTLVYFGGLAYGIYLFHPFVGELIDKVVAPGQDSAIGVAFRFCAMVVGSFLVAWVLKLVVEDPFIKIGRRLAQRRPRRQNPRTRVERTSSDSAPIESPGGGQIHREGDPKPGVASS
jgi:peptidoglycan/LPS O-acetylase OafA/YrhL